MKASDKKDQKPLRTIEIECTSRLMKIITSTFLQKNRQTTMIMM